MIGADEAALWRLAVESPAVPGALEVYGDWLLIHDPVRGELLHERLRSTKPFPLTLEQHFAESKAWAAALGLAGIVDSLSIDPLPRMLSIPAPHVARIEPILEALPFLAVSIDFSERPSEIATTFAHPAIARIRDFSFSAMSETGDDSENYPTIIKSYFGAMVIPALCASPHVTGFESLWISYESGSDCARQLAGVPFTRLRKLTIRAQPIGDAGATALAGSPHLATLRELILFRCQIGDAGAFALASSPYLAGLETLEVVGNCFSEAGAALLRAMPLRSLTGV